ncbi:MAG TPA: hypothetical protein VIF83_10575 [Gemmatimonadaceae bacterium]|jgi:hypothetical protein
MFVRRILAVAALIGAVGLAACSEVTAPTPGVCQVSSGSQTCDGT